MERIASQLRIDTPLGELAATWTPSPAGDARPVLVCIPGGTYTRAYFDLQVPADPTYSFVAHAHDAGWSTLCVDPLGTGAGARPTHVEVGLDEQADALAAALAAVPGEVHAPRGFVAVGHSMGGYVAMRQQARHRSYRALAILGTTNDAVAPLQLPDELRTAAQDPVARAALVAQIAAGMPDPYLAPDRSDMLDWFHLADVPQPVRDADLGTLTVVPRRCAAEGTVPFTCRDDAATIDVPVLLAYGEVDVSAAPHREPAFFTASDDVSLVVLRGSAHCHNMARTRHVLWDRALRWAAQVTD